MHQFGSNREKLTKREVTRRDRICREEGGIGYVQADMPEGTRGWFNARDVDGREVEKRVLERVPRGDA